MVDLESFNKANKWKKRGMSLVPMRYDHELKGIGLKIQCLISIFADDGTISVSTAGIELGQGLNTKVRQTVAKELGVGMELIKIKPTIGLISPNNSVTGGSWGSELSVAAAVEACAIINRNLSQTRDRMGSKATWQETVSQANKDNVDLCGRYMIVK